MDLHLDHLPRLMSARSFESSGSNSVGPTPRPVARRTPPQGLASLLEASELVLQDVSNISSSTSHHILAKNNKRPWEYFNPSVATAAAATATALPFVFTAIPNAPQPHHPPTTSHKRKSHEGATAGIHKRVRRPESERVRSKFIGLTYSYPSKKAGPDAGTWVAQKWFQGRCLLFCCGMKDEEEAARMYDAGIFCETGETDVSKFNFGLPGPDVIQRYRERKASRDEVRRVKAAATAMRKAQHEAALRALSAREPENTVPVPGGHQ